jgi:hypothetical protein
MRSIQVWFGLALLGIGLAQTQAQVEPASTDAENAAPPREQTIYVPYEKLRETFEKDGRGVYIPYERFQELWKAARASEKTAAEIKPPTPAVITEADSEATVGKETVQVKARLKIDLLDTGWLEVPLRLADTGVMSATLVTDEGKEEPARLAVMEDGSHKLLIENKDKTARTIGLRLEYAKKFNKTPGRNDISFAAPQAPVNRWQVRVQDSGVKINIEPLIAATEPPADHANRPTESMLLAFVGAAPAVKIDWTAKAEGASGLTALASVDAQQEVRVEEGAIHTRARLSYSISRAELTQLTIEVPADQKVVNVSEANVRQWSVEAGDKTQKITVQLFEPANQSETITVELEQFSEQPAAPKPDEPKPAETGGRRTLEVPVIKALDVSRQKGVVVVYAAEGLQVEPSKREGLLQVDAADLPKSFAKKPHSLAYRYAALPFGLALDVIKIRPRVVATELVAVNLEPEQLTLDLHAVFTVERAGVFELLFDVPAGFEVRDVRGDAVAGAEPAPIDAHHLEGEDKTRLVVDLSRKSQGRFGVFVQLQKRLSDPNLLGPTGKSSDIAISVPRVALDSIERTDGRLLIYAPESLRVNPSKQSGLRSVSLAEATSGMEVARMAPQSPDKATRPVLSFVFTKSPVELSLSVERRKPYVAVGQLLQVRVDPGVAKYQATFQYEIRYSGVKSLRLDIPAELATEIRNNTPGIAEKPIEPPPTDLEKGYVAWSLTGEGELLGTVTVRLTWEKPLENLEVGKSIELPTPQLRPRDVDRAWGQVVLAKAETIDLVPAGKPTGLRPIDPQHDLMPGAAVSDAALAFEFQDVWSLAMTATRYQLESVKHTSIERGLVRVVATRANQLAVQALYRMRSARQRLAVELPDGVEFDTEPLRINGQPTPLERGAQGEFFVPLVGHGDNEPFLLELRFIVPNNDTNIELPAFPDEPAVQKVFISAFVPQELSLVGYQGPWTDEQTLRFISPFRRILARRFSDDSLVNWVREGVSMTGNPTDTFPIDGQSFIYSTLRPESGEAGRLRLSTINGNWLSGMIFLGVLGVGIALVRQPMYHRAVALVALVIALLLIGVFLPTLSSQVMFGGLWLAMLLTGLVWIIAYLLRGRAPQLREAPPAASEPPPATAEALSMPSGGATSERGDSND